MIHSDQGTQYGSDAWRRFCKANHLEPSTSRRGNCWDNAVAESFFSSLKKERIKKRISADRATAVEDKAEYIEQFYNRVRRHSFLGGVSPEEFEAAAEGGGLAAAGVFGERGDVGRWRWRRGAEDFIEDEFAAQDG